MGEASRLKKARRAEKVAEGQKFRIVVCAYPDASLEPTAELLKAAVIYGDEVLLHSPTAIFLSAVAAVSSFSGGELLDFLRQVAPALGQTGAAFEESMAQLESGPGSKSIGALLDNAPALRKAIAAIDPSVAGMLDELGEGFAAQRRAIDEAIEKQLVDAGVPSVEPAIKAGLLKLLPVEAKPDLFEGYIKALWSLLSPDPRVPSKGPINQWVRVPSRQAARGAG